MKSTLVSLNSTDLRTVSSLINVNATPHMGNWRFVGLMVSALGPVA